MNDAIKGKILIKTGNTNFWTVAHADKVLDLGQLGYNTETKEFKTGDGVHPWATLTSHTHQVSDIVDDNGKTVQQLYDELTIGGRNLIKNSTFITGLGGYSVRGTVYTIERSTKECYHEQNSLKIVGTVAGTPGADIEIQLTQKCEISSNYIFSCWIKAIQPTTVTIRFGDSTNDNVANVTTSWTKITIPLKSGGSQVASAYMTFGGACKAYLCCLNLERGNKASDHTPAPEEVANVLHTHSITDFADFASHLDLVTSPGSIILKSDRLQDKQASDFSLSSHKHDSAYSALSHNHDSAYLKNSGGNLTGELTIKGETVLRGSSIVYVTLINNWVSYGGSYGTPKAYKEGNTVTLTGLIKGGTISGTLSQIGALPEGYRPANSTICVVSTNGGLASINIYSTGEIFIYNTTYTGNPAGYLALSGICFRVA